MTEQSPEDAAAQRAAEQIRLRKERREAKIKAGGAARLNKINGLSGRAPGMTACPSSCRPRRI
jgi:GET complex subunit GET2